MTPTETKARKALVLPRLIRPRRSCTSVTRTSAYTGTPSLGCTLAKSFEPGIASSRANAHVHRDAATVIEMEQNIVIARTRKVSANPPPGEPITMWKIYGSAWPPGARRTSSSGGMVTQIGIMKKSPAIPPTGTQRESALGTLTAGSDTSSAIEAIMPIAENVYADGSRPMKKVKPPQPEKLVS